MCTDVVPASELSIDVSIEYDMNVVVRLHPYPRYAGKDLEASAFFEN